MRMMAIDSDGFTDFRHFGPDKPGSRQADSVYLPNLNRIPSVVQSKTKVAWKYISIHLPPRQL